MQINEAIANPTEAEGKPIVSPFEEVKQMNPVMAVNVLIQAANAAQGAGALSVRDSVLVASAAEFLTQKNTEKKDEKS
jgi:hypothetical protein|tara:strand:- start:132 stop:365 length:234 start_codon:yes stop_codon:yes gene_type:complete